MFKNLSDKGKDIKTTPTYHLPVVRRHSSRKQIGWAPVAHAYNLSYSGNRDQEDYGSKTVPANKFAKLYLENT
jgi:hypothetical protein